MCYRPFAGGAPPRPVGLRPGAIARRTRRRRPAQRSSVCSVDDAQPSHRSAKTAAISCGSRSVTSRSPPRFAEWGEGFAVGTAGLRHEVTVGEEGLHRPGQGRHMPHRVTRSRISGLCRGEADDSTHSLRVCQPPVTFPGKWPSSGWYCRYPAGFTRPGGSRCAWSGGFGGVGYCRYPPNTCKTGFEAEPIRRPAPFLSAVLLVLCGLVRLLGGVLGALLVP